MYIGLFSHITQSKCVRLLVCMQRRQAVDFVSRSDFIYIGLFRHHTNTARQRCRNFGVYAEKKDLF